jgi:hypothetical protein
MYLFPWWLVDLLHWESETYNRQYPVSNSTYLMIIDMRGPDGRDSLSCPHLAFYQIERWTVKGWGGSLSSIPLLLYPVGLSRVLAAVLQWWTAVRPSVSCTPPRKRSEPQGSGPPFDILNHQRIYKIIIIKKKTLIFWFWPHFKVQTSRTEFYLFFSV